MSTLMMKYPRSEEPVSEITQPLQQHTTTKMRLMLGFENLKNAMLSVLISFFHFQTKNSIFAHIEIKTHFSLIFLIQLSNWDDSKAEIHDLAGD